MQVIPNRSLKFLGLISGENMRFLDHVKYTSQKDLNIEGLCKDACPNIDGSISYKHLTLRSDSVIFAIPISK